MHIYNSDDVMLDFICMGPVDLSGARRKRKNTKSKILAHSGTRTHNPEISKSDALPTELAGLVVRCLFKWPYYIMYSRYLCIHVHYYKYQNDKGQRILSGKSTVLCYILEYIEMLYK